MPVVKVRADKIVAGDHILDQCGVRVVVLGAHPAISYPMSPSIRFVLQRETDGYEWSDRLAVFRKVKRVEGELSEEERWEHLAKPTPRELDMLRRCAAERLQPPMERTRVTSQTLARLGRKHLIDRTTYRPTADGMIVLQRSAEKR